MAGLWAEEDFVKSLFSLEGPGAGPNFFTLSPGRSAGTVQLPAANGRQNHTVGRLRGAHAPRWPMSDVRRSRMKKLRATVQHDEIEQPRPDPPPPLALGAASN